MAAHSHSHSQAQGDERTAYFMDQLFAVAVCGRDCGRDDCPVAIESARPHVASEISSDRACRRYRVRWCW
jgi:hypothetical protein